MILSGVLRHWPDFFIITRSSTPSKTRAPRTPARPRQRPARLRDAGATAEPAPFHAGTDPGDPVYHDSSDCPNGQEIRRDGNDEPSTDGRRQCDWCARHPVTA